MNVKRKRGLLFFGVLLVLVMALCVFFVGCGEEAEVPPKGDDAPGQTTPGGENPGSQGENPGGSQGENPSGGSQGENPGGQEIPADHTHTLVKHEATDPTCVKDGNIEYWYCDGCKNYFSDAEGKTQTTQAAVTVKADGTSHAWTDWEYQNDATCEKDGNEKRTCTNEGCDAYESRPKAGTKKSHTYENGVCTQCGQPNESGIEDGKITVRPDGKIEFGSYPQSEEADETVTAALNEIAGEWTEDNENWTSYRYYRSQAPDDFMYYTDQEYNGAKYRGVYIESARPYSTQSNGSSSTNQATNGYYVGYSYWFKWEPIRWRVIEKGKTADKSSLLMADLILDAQAWNNDSNRGGWAKDDVANKYDKSTIGPWLNETFLNWAFGPKDQALIETTTVKTDVSQVSALGCPTCEDVHQKVFLLSYKEVTDKDHGLGDKDKESAERVLCGSAYAKAQGLEVVDTEKGSSYWWLRTGVTLDHYPDHIGADGYAGPYWYNHHAQCACYTEAGVVPALRVVVPAAE